MRILVNPLNRVRPPSLPAEQTRIRDEEHLLLAIMLQPRQKLARRLLLDLFPRVKRRAQPSRVRDVLAQGQFAVDVQLLALRIEDCEVGVLVHEAFGFLLEGLYGVVVPPVGVVACFVVVAAVGIECCKG